MKTLERPGRAASPGVDALPRPLRQEGAAPAPPAGHLLHIGRPSGRRLSALREAGYEVRNVDGRRGFSSGDYDAILLDPARSGSRGLDAIRRIRTENPHTPLLVLGAPAPLEIKLAYYELGADDVLDPSVSAAELLARLRAALRRIHGRHDLLAAGDLRLDRLGRRVFWRDEEIQLTRKEFLLIEHLMLQANRVVSRAAVIEQVWEPGFDAGGNIVDVYIRQLRKKIDLRFGRKLIHTVRGEGYLLRVAPPAPPPPSRGSFMRF